MQIHYQKIAEALTRKLPGEVSHRKMLPEGRLLKVSTSHRSNLKKSSVLLLLFPEKGELHVCLIKRPAHMKYHAGQIAFPGGRVEANESVKATALRETNEEIGVHQEKIQILGKLSELYVEVSQYIIQPFVGWINEKPQFNINDDEVEKIVLFPLFRYINNRDKIILETITGKLQVPCIKYNNEVIWGATAMILSEFYDATSYLLITRE